MAMGEIDSEEAGDFVGCTSGIINLEIAVNQRWQDNYGRVDNSGRLIGGYGSD